jgi:hypothetical protein
MAESIKFTEEELKSIQDVRDGFDRKVSEFGYMYLERKITSERLEAIAVEEDRLNAEYQELVEKERDIVKQLNEKYGTGTVDLTNGEFQPAE